MKVKSLTARNKCIIPFLACHCEQIDVCYQNICLRKLDLVNSRREYSFRVISKQFSRAVANPVVKSVVLVQSSFREVLVRMCWTDKFHMNWF